MTVHEVSRLTGVSIRALQYYDRIGLLRPSDRTPAGYRLYGDTELARLQQILLFRELEFPLRDIRAILESPTFDRGKALDQQIRLRLPFVPDAVSASAENRPADVSWRYDPESRTILLTFRSNGKAVCIAIK